MTQEQLRHRAAELYPFYEPCSEFDYDITNAKRLAWIDGYCSRDKEVEELKRDIRHLNAITDENLR